ncbi:SigE family RNA polymerase sigma factor [Isoptericola sp. S6320L]|uniref:SigE family RNA polymerase sigma factor n=1 Tax=Isoptericola sp. S6320L TaxID=2926411 RepID=UPI001FF54AA6|nr:SigE family RNA polymerase sigma factor [Isoptericola sp. S6320L]MCK0118440.1 SigE family RNA polymerase sigma factor [Isoptericola sp. S6320L]
MIEVPLGAPFVGADGGRRSDGVPAELGGGPRGDYLAAGASAAEQFTAFARDRSGALYRIAYVLCGDEHRAYDLMQTALERTYRRWHRVESDPFAYARKVVSTARIDAWRRTKKEVLRATPDDGGTAGASGAAARSAPDHGAAVVERDRLVRALQALPPQQRRVVVLRYLLDRGEQQTADDLGISCGAVKSAASRGLAALRRVMGTTGEDVR